MNNGRPARLDELRRRVIAEFLEMPGLSLSIEQGARLWGIETHACRRLLDDLVEQHFLRATLRGLYVRRDDV
jgi:response regulator of citrate/malate metabolism